MKIALIGNPNSGKTTLFNNLTGASAHVGNWPGVTVEKKSGFYKKNKDQQIEIIDLPGIYSLSPYTPEEVISRNYLITEKPDLVINIVDATNLERNLYLTTQVLEIDVPVIVALNMMDVVLKEGTEIHPLNLEKALGVKVIPIVALKSKGITELMNICIDEAGKKRVGSSILSSTPLNPMIELLSSKLNGSNKLYHSIKIIENDEIETEKYGELVKLTESFKNDLKNEIFEDDFSGMIADYRYKFVSDHIDKVLKKVLKAELSRSDKIDKVLTHKWFSIPIFIAVMFLVFHLTFSETLFFIPITAMNSEILGIGTLYSPGVMLFNMVDWVSGWFGETLSLWLAAAPEWVSGLLVEGLWAGLSSVLSFIPQILCLFFFITILEDSGYMARVAFIMDRAFRKFGLSGKSFVPLLMCFGCAVPGIMATRTLENAKERKLTIMLTPFFSCGAKLPIWAVFAGIMYEGAYADLVVFAVYMIGILVSVILAIILSNTIMKGDASPFIMELPAYHGPRLKNIGRNLWTKFKGYLYRAGTIIAAAIVVIWFFSSFGWYDGVFGYLPGMIDEELLGIAAIDYSMLAFVSKGLSYVFYPLGFAQGATGYMFVVAAFTGLIAKEMVPATLGTFVGMTAEQVLDGEILQGSDLSEFINTIPIAAQWSFLIFNLLVIPCMAAVATAAKELSSRKDFWKTILFWFLTAYIVSMLIYFGITYFVLGIIFMVLVAGLVTFLLIRASKKKNNMNRQVIT